jgi:hypothetical protein
MSIHEHARFKVFSKHQHPYRHDSSEFLYFNEALPSSVNNFQEAMDYIFSVLYPKTLPSVATTADLPTGVDTPNVGDLPPSIGDYRVVEDDGDGKAAGYGYQQWDGDVAPVWKKLYDMDWGTNSVMSSLYDQTQWLFPRKYGNTDYDPDTELPLAGDNAGQHFFGGDLANQNLTLHANNGDPVGNSGYIQLADNARPLLDLLYDLGTATKRFNNVYAGTLNVGTGTMVITSNATNGSITDTSKDIRFSDNDLTTTGEINTSVLNVIGLVESLEILEDTIKTTALLLNLDNDTVITGNLKVENDITIGVGSITSTSGAIDFGNENLDTTGDIGATNVNSEVITIDSLLKISAATIESLAANGSITIKPTGLGQVIIDGDLSGDNAAFLDVDADTAKFGQIEFSTNLIDTALNPILIGKDLLPETDNAIDLGLVTQRFVDIFATGNLTDGTSTVEISEIGKLQFANYQDIAKVTPAAAGDGLFYDSVSGKWLAASPNSKVAHGSIGGLTTGDAGHSQFVLLAGRGGGQIIDGGNATGESLTLRDNFIDQRSLVFFNGDFYPLSTINIGKSTQPFSNLYMTGQAFGLRTENDTLANITGAADALTKGRLWFATDNETVYVDLGGTLKAIGATNGYKQIKTNVELQSPIDVSAYITDARDAIWQLCDSNNEVLGVTISKTQTEVTISVDIPLPAGNYKLLGIQV